jgi:hypothetical protein
MMPKSVGAFSRFQNEGQAASSENPNASMAGPQVHERVWGPIITASTSEMTRKMDEMAGMLGRI